MNTLEDFKHKKEMSSEGHVVTGRRKELAKTTMMKVMSSTTKNKAATAKEETAQNSSGTIK